MKKRIIESKPIILVTALVLILLTCLLFLSFTKAVDVLDNGVKVEPKSELTYYLDISYDGVDRNINDSSNATKVSIFSDYIYVEDKLPDGLTFDSFITSEDGSVGATLKGNDSISCSGSVINDTEKSEESNTNFYGLHYNEETRTVSFKVQNLQAGCHLTVGIVTITPESPDNPATKDIIEKRMDFYNTATAKEKNQFITSNTVHAYMGEDIQNMPKVTYEYLSEEDYKIAPDPSVFNGEYAENSTVNIASSPVIEGYEFSGWRIENDGGTPIISTTSNFIMPNRDVKLVGTFTKIKEYNVSYEIKGEIPNGYIKPNSKNYYVEQNVTVDDLKAGAIINGYKFLGWRIQSPTNLEATKYYLSNGEKLPEEFVMPEDNVIIYGEFELIKYKVEYKFYETALPENYEQYLPDSKEYIPGETVKLDDVKGEPEGYEFLGWYQEDNFEMPEQDVIIYGEWKISYGTFQPEITKKIINPKDYYKKGDIVKYEIVVSNTNNQVGDLTDIYVKEFNEKAKFLEGEGYTVRTEHLVLIPTLKYGNPLTIYAEYEVTDEVGTIDNTVKIIGGSSTSGAELDTSIEYIATASFDIYSEIKISKKVSNEDNSDKVFQFHITSEKGYDTWLNLTNNEEDVLYIEPNDTYYIKEVIPQEYTLESVTGDITTNGEELEVKLGEKYTVEFINKYRRKGYYHSDGRVVNEVQPDDDKDENGDGIPDKYQVTVYYTSVNGYLYFGENVYPEDYSESLESQSVVLNKYDENGNLSKIGIARLTEKDIPGASPWLGYEEKEEWDTITPVPGLEVEDGDHFIITFDRITVPPSTIPGEYVTVYFEVINGYFYFEENVYPDDYQESYEISMDIPLYDENGVFSKNGKAYLTEDRIPKVAPLVGYNFKDEWDTITPVPGLEVQDGDRFVIEFVAGASVPSSGPPTFHGTEGTIKIIWDDEGHEDERPSEIEFELYYEDDWKPIDTVVLGVTDDLFFEWTDLKYGTWGVVTRFLGESKNPGSCFYGYPYDTVGITMDGTNIVITFKYVGYTSVC